MINTFNLQQGDALWRLKSGVKHWGVYLGWDNILQITPRTQPHTVSLIEFCNDAEVHVVVSHDTDRPSIIARAYEVLQSPFEYSWWRNNCQHLKNYVLTGRAYSEDINALTIGATLIGFAALLRR